MDTFLLIDKHFSCTDGVRRLGTRHAEQRCRHGIQPHRCDRIAQHGHFFFGNNQLRERNFFRLQMLASRLAVMHEQIRRNVFEHKNICAVFADQNISDAVAAQSQAHQRTEIIPMRQRVIFAAQTANDNNRAVLSLCRHGIHPFRQKKDHAAFRLLISAPENTAFPQTAQQPICQRRLVHIQKFCVRQIALFTAGLRLLRDLREQNSFFLCARNAADDIVCTRHVSMSSFFRLHL